MRRLQFYDPETGIFSPRGYCGHAVEQNVPAGLAAFDVTDVVDFDWQAMRVESGALVDYRPPAPPDTEFETYAWDAATRRYVSTQTAAGCWRGVRAERDRLLTACDWIVARALERGEEVPPAWREYRQALRDITLQADPLAIVWPQPPQS